VELEGLPESNIGVANLNRNLSTVEWIGSVTGTTVEDPPSGSLQIHPNLNSEEDPFKEDCEDRVSSI